MYTPYLRHLKEIADGSHHAPAKKQNLCHLLHSACLHIYTVNTHAPAVYPECHYQHNCYSLYDRCVCSGFPTLLSFLSIIVQTTLELVGCQRNKVVQASYSLHMPMAIMLNYSIDNIQNVV